MTNQEAIETIKSAQAQIEWDYPMDYAVAFGMAISALQAQEALQLTCNNLATDTIYRYEAIDALECINGVEEVLRSLPSAQPEPQWIPVSERLPEPRVDVWVNSDIGQIQGYYEEHIGIWYASFGQGRDYLELIVNAWMPLPEPFNPKEKSNACD